MTKSTRRPKAQITGKATTADTANSKSLATSKFSKGATTEKPTTKSPKRLTNPKTLPPLYRESDYTRQKNIDPTAPGTRSEFRRDYARLVHSPAFRRLQGKTQLFPGAESDFFRNRLTHSLEVAQIAKGIALKLNGSVPYFQINPIDTDLIETAALAHDLGHPPFGHNGEYALDECMRHFGGFEGNAQTLRIVARLEKKEYPVADSGGACGLNFTHRTLGAVLKYDRVIALVRDEKDSLSKGYYESERKLVKAAKESIVGGKNIPNPFRTIECDIMDIADDIAYSTYDLEDAFKAGFLTPLEILAKAYDEDLIEKITSKVNRNINSDLTAKDVLTIFMSTFGKFIVQAFEGVNRSDPSTLIRTVVDIYQASREAAASGYSRTSLTSELVNEFIGGVSVRLNEEHPALSSIEVASDTRVTIEVLKHFTYEAMIMSPRLKIVEYRGRDIVKTIFEALTSSERSGHLLLPDDCRHAYEGLKEVAQRKRLVCDFIAGMTDKYAVEFYGRLTAIEHGQSFFKPF